MSLDIKTRATEVQISELGRLCGPPPKQSQADNVDQSRTVAELWLLQRCIDATRLAIGGADLLRAAQFLVISRLLLKSLNDESHKPTSLPVLQERITTLRRHAILRVDVVLASPQSSSASMVKAACAYCLITSASSADAFKYAQRLRLEKLRKTVQVEQMPPGFAVSVLRYVLSTSQILKRVFGRALTDTLSNLQRRPILSDQDLVGSEVLGSDGILALVSPDIRSFSPYFKRDPVSTSEFASNLDNWTSDACEVLTTALEQQLETVTDTSEILGLRRDLYSALLPLYFSSASCATIHRTIQQKLGERLQQLVHSTAAQLEAIATDLVGCEPTSQTRLDLWKPEVATMPLVGGGTAFLDHVHKRHHGTGSQMINRSRSLRKWTASVSHMLADFDRSRSVRWRDMLEEPDDEQEDEAEDVVRALSDRDPTNFSTQARASLKTAVGAFEAKIAQAAFNCIDDEDAHGVEVVVHYLRVIRLTLNPLRQAFPQEAALNDLESTVPKLHKIVAEKVVAQVLASFDTSSHDRSSAAPTVDHLPSPATFDLLEQLCEVMSTVGGTDIWSPAAVAKLQSILADKFLSEPNGRSEFDQAYLGCALASTRSSPSSEEAKAAREYWARTKLLFGVLAD